MTSRSTALYRLFDASGRLLYIGIGYSVSNRMRAHAAEKDWWPLVADRTVEWFSGRDDAEVAEERAIRDEHPVFNKTKHRQRQRPRTGGVAVLAEVGVRADEYQRTTRELDDARHNLAALVNQGSRAGMTQAHLLRLIGGAWSREYLRIVLGLNKRRSRSGE